MASAPIPRNVPNGNWYCLAIAHRKRRSVPNPRRLARFATPLLQPPKYNATTSPIPIKLPRRLPTRSVRNVPRSPRNAPIIHIILPAPLPHPSPPRTILYPAARPQSKKLPKPAPRIPSRIPAANPGNRICRSLPAKIPVNPLPGGTNAENISPAANPGQLTTSGSSRTRKSVTVKIRIKHVKKSHCTVVCVIPNYKNAAKNSNPVASSINGYIGEIGSPHVRHFPRSHSQANTGTLSYGLIGAPHRGQRDPGVTMEISSGIRVMQTFRKLPTIIPNRKKKTAMMTTVCAATPRPLFPICHTHPPASMNRTSSRASSLTLLLCGLCELCGLCVSSFLRPAAPTLFLLLEATTVNLELAIIFMHWFERKIRRYEHRRWTTDDNRRVQPFHWGVEHIGGSPNDPNPAAFVRDYARQAIESSREWYAASPAPDYRLDVGRSATAREKEHVLTFTSSIESPWPENNTVHAQLFPARETV